MRQILKKHRRLVVVALVICMLIPIGLNTASVWATDSTGLCKHHPKHTDHCGFVENIPEIPCDHIHDESCYDRETLICTHYDGCPMDGSCGFQEEVPGAECQYSCPICKEHLYDRDITLTYGALSSKEIAAHTMVDLLEDISVVSRKTAEQIPVTSDQEWSSDAGKTWMTCPDGELALEPGTYLIRNINSDTHETITVSFDVTLSVYSVLDIDKEEELLVNEGRYAQLDPETKYLVTYLIQNEAGESIYAEDKVYQFDQPNEDTLDEPSDSVEPPRFDPSTYSADLAYCLDIANLAFEGIRYDGGPIERSKRPWLCLSFTFENADPDEQRWMYQFPSYFLVNDQPEQVLPQGDGSYLIKGNTLYLYWAERTDHDAADLLIEAEWNLPEDAAAVSVSFTNWDLIQVTFESDVSDPEQEPSADIPKEPSNTTPPTELPEETPSVPVVDPETYSQAVKDFLYTARFVVYAPGPETFTQDGLLDARVAGYLLKMLDKLSAEELKYPDVAEMLEALPELAEHIQIDENLPAENDSIEDEPAENVPNSPDNSQLVDISSQDTPKTDADTSKELHECLLKEHIHTVDCYQLIDNTPVLVCEKEAHTHNEFCILPEPTVSLDSVNNDVAAAQTSEAEDSPDEFLDHVLPTEASENIKIKLFDYDTLVNGSLTYDTYGRWTLPEGYSNVEAAMIADRRAGINLVPGTEDTPYPLLFTWGKYASDPLLGFNVSQNYAYQGITKKNLDENGFPVLAESIAIENNSLGYLFDDQTTDFKRVYNVESNLFQKNGSMYSYDSQHNFASYVASEDDEFSGTFHIYDAPAVGYNRDVGFFFPFSKGHEVFGENADGSLRALSDAYAFQTNDQIHTYVNHYFGMMVDADFYQPFSGTIVNDEGIPEEMIFTFAGDDDCWVFIDDVLVLDIGGKHGIIDGSINFTTGAVTVSNGRNAEAAYTNGTLKQLFQLAYEEKYGTEDEIQTAMEEIGFTGDTFKSNTLHHMKIFYLERGNYTSNCSFYFNVLPEVSPYYIHKTDSVSGNGVKGAQFKIFADEACEEEYSSEYIQAGQIFTTGPHGYAKTASLDDGEYYFKEIQPPDRYMIDQPYYKLVVADTSTSITLYDASGQEVSSITNTMLPTKQFPVSVNVAAEWGDDISVSYKLPITVQFLNAAREETRQIVLSADTDWAWRETMTLDNLSTNIQSMKEIQIGSYTGTDLGDLYFPVYTWEYFYEEEPLDGLAVTNEDGTITYADTVYVTILNDLVSPELPRTGGSGTTAIYWTGTAFLIGSMLLIEKKRKLVKK